MSEENKEVVEETTETVETVEESTENVEKTTAEVEEIVEESDNKEDSVEYNIAPVENLVVKAILGTKVGMTQVWNEEDKVIPVTVIHAPVNIISQIKTLEKDGYCSIQLAADQTKENRISKPEKGHLAKANAGVRKRLVELRLDSVSSSTDGFELGQAINVEAFAAGEEIDIVGTSKGHGFSGGMKRHNFKGQGASHGNHRAHRVPGSIGACATPGRVFKGKRMAGQYGNHRVTVQNLKIVAVDLEKEVIIVKGAVPGVKGSPVIIKSAIKSALKNRVKA